MGFSCIIAKIRRRCNPLPTAAFSISAAKFLHRLLHVPPPRLRLLDRHRRLWYALLSRCSHITGNPVLFGNSGLDRCGGIYFAYDASFLVFHLMQIKLIVFSACYNCRNVCRILGHFHRSCKKQESYPRFFQFFRKAVCFPFLMTAGTAAADRLLVIIRIMALDKTKQGCYCVNSSFACRG